MALASLTLAFFLPPAAAAAPQAIVKIRGVSFDRSVIVGGHALDLRGATPCRYLTFKVYTAAFYAPSAARNDQEILATAPKRLVLHYHREIDKQDIREATEKGLAGNPHLNLRELRARVDLISSWYENVREGDRFALEYTPGIGSELFFNGESKGVIPGEDFARAYFGIWLSEYPLDKTYRDRLLGH